MFVPYAGEILNKNHMVQTTQIFELFDQKKKNPKFFL